MIDVERGRAVLSGCVPGDILNGTVERTAPEGVWLEVHGAEAFLPADRIALSPLCGPERFRAGDTVFAAVLRIDRHCRRLILTHRELLGTFREAVLPFRAGGIYPAICCGDGLAELAPNLLALVGGEGSVGERFAAEITEIDGHRCLIFAKRVDRLSSAAETTPFTYYTTSGRIKRWQYDGGGNISAPETRFCR